MSEAKSCFSCGQAVGGAKVVVLTCYSGVELLRSCRNLLMDKPVHKTKRHPLMMLSLDAHVAQPRKRQVAAAQG